MKRFLILGLLIVAFIVLYVNVNAEVDEIVIPEAAIRVRVIANSNQIHDQNMKMKVKKYIETSISPTLLNVRDVNEARGVIKNSLSDLDSGIKELFSDNLYDKDFVIH